MPPVIFSEMLKLPAYGWWGIADGYSQRNVNHSNNHSWILHQWSAQNLGMHKGLVLLCRAGEEYAGKGSHNRNKGRIKNCNGVDGKQEHYKVLGLARNATALEIKSAFRRLARRYHPDVNKDPDADDSFKSIRLAYEVLSNEATRNQYDKALRLQELRTNRHWRKWAESELKRKRRYYWEQLKQQAPGATWEQDHGAETPFSSFYSYSSFEDEEFVNSPTEERAPVEDLLRHVWFTIFCSQMLGSQIALTLFSFCALLNRQIAPGYKVAHIVACLIGGQRGILVMVGLSFTSWFYGNSGDNLVALIALALWIGVDLARFVPIPRGAILAMTYLCYKLQLEGS